MDRQRRLIRTFRMKRPLSNKSTVRLERIHKTRRSSMPATKPPLRFAMLCRNGRACLSHYIDCGESVHIHDHIVFVVRGPRRAAR